MRRERSPASLARRGQVCARRPGRSCRAGLCLTYAFAPALLAPCKPCMTLAAALEKRFSAAKVRLPQPHADPAVALLGLAASVASAAAAPIAPSAALSAVLAGWLAQGRWKHQAPGGDAGAPGTAVVAPQLKDASAAAASGGSQAPQLPASIARLQAAAAAIRSPSRGPASWPRPDVSAGAAAAGSAGAEAATGGRRTPTPLPRTARRQVAADGQAALEASSSSLLSMVQQIAKLRGGLSPTQGEQHVPSGGGSGMDAAAGGGGDAEAAGTSGVVAGERLLARALANVQRLTTLIRERDTRIKRLEQQLAVMAATTAAAALARSQSPTTASPQAAAAQGEAPVLAPPLPALAPADQRAPEGGERASAALAAAEAALAAEASAAARLRGELAGREAELAELRSQLASAAEAEARLAAALVEAQEGSQHTTWSLLQKEVRRCGDALERRQGALCATKPTTC